VSNTLNLAGTWQLTCAARNITVDYTVPGDVHSALIAAGQIPHPYKGTNELAVRWVADEEWVAVRAFQIDCIEDGEYLLQLNFLDTMVSIYVNDERVLRSENCFRSFRRNVTNKIRVGANEIKVVLHSNTKAAKEKQAAQPFYIPYSVSNNPIPNGNMLRKPQCHFGWDWNLAIVPFGICGKVQIVLPSMLIDEIDIEQSFQADNSVVLSVAIQIRKTLSAFSDKCFVQFAEQRVEVELENYSTIATADCKFTIQNPKLWWPAGQGEQHLYDLEMRCGDQVERRKIGIRKLELICGPDDTGNRFAFKVNDREIFCKGANWIPADALPSNATRELTRKLLQAAKDANMNMIRVWGGGYYEKDFFYDICDELGLLVWQDFMFSCSLYPSTPEFLDEVKIEARYQVERLQHHACLALWCGDNEVLGALTWFEESRKNRDRYLVNYDRLNRTLEETVKQTDTSAIWWPSSPSPGVLDFGDTWHDDSKGDMHFWSVWHEGRDFEHYYDVKPRFCSEFGFQSFPSLRLIKEFSTSEEDLNISSAVMEHHQRNKGGNARIAETMFRNFRFPMDFGNFVYLSQVQHGLAMKMAVEYWRSLKPHCMGTLYWQLNDTWPVASWSGLDHGGSWKLLHYMARRFYAPVLVTARIAGDDIVVSAVHDLAEAIETEVEVVAVSVHGAKTTLYKQMHMLAGDGQELTRLDRRNYRQETVLFVSWRDEQGVQRRSHLAPMPYKHMELPKPKLSSSVVAKSGALSINITVKNLALYVALECDVAGHFSDNAFDLFPGETTTITFTPDNPADLIRAKDTLVIRDLYSSSH
jgi:beta-mannosidase